jgi:hypothetical protein
VAWVLTRLLWGRLTDQSFALGTIRSLEDRKACEHIIARSDLNGISSVAEFFCKVNAYKSGRKTRVTDPVRGVDSWERPHILPNFLSCILILSEPDINFGRVNSCQAVS